MDNGRITGGSVSFLKRLNKGNYEHEEASTKLDFVVHDNADAGPVIDRAEAEAKASVFLQLGIPTERPLAQTAAPVAQTAPASQAATSPPAAPKAPRHAKSNSIAAIEAAEKLAAEQSETTAQTATSATVQGDEDPLAPATAGAAEQSETTAQTAASATVQGDEDPLAPAGASDMTASTASMADLTARREVTDADLASAAAKHNERLVKVHKEAGTVLIRDLIGGFLPPGKPLRELPQSMRQEFLNKLEGLA